jgi:uncharacterized alkaline shock family protein YloU
VARIATAAAAEVHAVDPPPGQAGRHRHPRDQARGIRRIRGRVRTRGRTRAGGAGPVRSGSAQRRGPRATAEVTGSRATVALVLSVRYPQPVLRVAAEVRDRVTARISQLCALEVTAVTVDVLAFTPPAERGRVQ